jgi:ABC-2 type transport system permease protein
MSAVGPAVVSDSLVMVRRNVKRQLRYPSIIVMLIAMPAIFLVLFVYVFGGQLGAGLPRAAGGAPGRGAYLRYITPGILAMTVASAALGTALSVAMDMTQGIVARFRTMSISRGAVLNGHVLGTLLQSLVALFAIFGLALAIGFRPDSTPLSWLAALAVLLCFSVALTWLSTALGLAAKSVETASNTPLLLTLLPFLSSAFIPVHTLPAGLRQFAHYQPFTPVTESVRHLLLGGPVAHDLIAAIAWSVGLGVVAYGWSIRLYERRPLR